VGFTASQCAWPPAVSGRVDAIQSDIDSDSFGHCGPPMMAILLEATHAIPDTRPAWLFRTAERPASGRAPRAPGDRTYRVYHLYCPDAIACKEVVAVVISAA